MFKLNEDSRKGINCKLQGCKINSTTQKSTHRCRVHHCTSISYHCRNNAGKKEATEKVKKVPLPNDTISGKIENLSFVSYNFYIYYIQGCPKWFQIFSVCRQSKKVEKHCCSDSDTIIKWPFFLNLKLEHFKYPRQHVFSRCRKILVEKTFLKIYKSVFILFLLYTS